MSAQKGDFISFSFNGVHSSDLGIIRTSDGSRFNENLLPTIQDKTVQVPGGDGTYFFGSYYTQRQFNVPIAFDNLKEDEVRKLYQVFGDKQIHELIFDERPYKVYMAKINGTPSIKTICFEVEGERVYKGEGTLNFICYYPFAKSRFKYLDEYTIDSVKEWDDVFNNKDEWSAASRMVESGVYDEIIVANNSSSINLYNPGDLEADFTLKFSIDALNSLTQINIGNEYQLAFDFSKISFVNNPDEYITINSKNELIEGWKLAPTGKYILSGNIYNGAITKGEFFKIPLCGEADNVSMTIVSNIAPEEIQYDYIYF